MQNLLAIHKRHGSQSGLAQTGAGVEAEIHPAADRVPFGGEGDRLADGVQVAPAFGQPAFALERFPGTISASACANMPSIRIGPASAGRRCRPSSINWKFRRANPQSISAFPKQRNSLGSSVTLVAPN